VKSSGSTVQPGACFGNQWLAMAASPFAMPVDSACIFMHDARVFMQSASET
jgi:zona occludens toxin (predicted ATPase)